MPAERSAERDLLERDEPLLGGAVSGADSEDLRRKIGQFAVSSGFEASPSGAGWRMVVPLRTGRQQAVYIGPMGSDSEGRTLAGLVSLCSPAMDRDARTLLRFNMRATEGHFAIRQLRGEEYFVLCRLVAADELERLDAAHIVQRMAEIADRFEDRLSRGADLY
jgi:hypothetical protein